MKEATKAKILARSKTSREVELQIFSRHRVSKKQTTEKKRMKNTALVRDRGRANLW